MGFIQEIWHFYLCISLLTIGMSFGTFIVLVATGVLFIGKRKLALSLMMSASGIGGLLVPVLVELIKFWMATDNYFAGVDSGLLVSSNISYEINPRRLWI